MATEAVGFANRGVITVGGTGGVKPTTATLGVVKDVEITLSAEHVPLYGWGSIKRQGVAKHSMKVAVKVGWVKFDPVKTTGWQFSWGAIPGADATGSITDSNLVHLFDITATFTMEDGQILKATITDVFFPDFPLKASEGQWIRIDMSGEGKDVVYANA